MRIVFDLDGTLADGSHREHFLRETPKKWDAYFEACYDDNPIEHAISVFHNLRPYNSIQIWTGRSEVVRGQTVKWLAGSNIFLPHNRFGGMPNIGQLLMRPTGDFTPDDELKMRWLADARGMDEEPHLVFEDRDRVVKMWRDEGIPCFQVAPGDF